MKSKFISLILLSSLVIPYGVSADNNEWEELITAGPVTTKTIGTGNFQEMVPAPLIGTTEEYLKNLNLLDDYYIESTNGENYSIKSVRTQNLRLQK